MSDCDGLCADCACAFPPVKANRRPNRASEKRTWQQDALFELSELAELYGVDEGLIKAVR
ncbi:hypothetical protein [Streptomyces sp. NPDC018045]|uniref:hypothetical protein n=1 Tax=Streptomyces sp. NPDC018045 TaxID=3365037 RepID=UPI0037A5B80C